MKYMLKKFIPEIWSNIKGAVRFVKRLYFLCTKQVCRALINFKSYFMSFIFNYYIFFNNQSGENKEPLGQSLIRGPLFYG